MCLIIAKPAGLRLPAGRIIESAALRNPDGFGFCTPDRWFRTTDYEEFREELARVGKDEPCIIHFRMATHGSVRTGNCHPFVHGGVGFAHNGVLAMGGRGDMTDSETFFLDVLCPEIDAHGFDSQEAQGAIERHIGFSRFAFMVDGTLRLYGGFREMPDGCLYSNMNFI